MWTVYHPADIKRAVANFFVCVLKVVSTVSDLIGTNEVVTHTATYVKLCSAACLQSTGCNVCGVSQTE